MTPPYTPAFFQAISDGSTRSARAVVPLLMSLVRPTSVVDVGCGWGKWLTVFREAGVKDVLGIDGPYVDPARTDLAANEFIPHDLTQPLTVKRRFDLAVSLEVAEHLPPEAADGFVSLLASLAPVVAFSAAIPGQGGTGHRNERWPDYWARKFAARGLLAVDAIRPAIWSHPDVEWWYAQNLLVFAAPHEIVIRPPLTRALADTHLHRLNLVHPRCFRRYTGEPEPPIAGG